MGSRTGKLLALLLTLVLSPGVGLTACSSEDKPAEPVPESTATATGTAALGRCDAIPAPDGMGCAAARAMVAQMAAPLTVGLPADVTDCLVDTFQDLPADDAPATVTLRFGAMYDCRAFTVLGTLQQIAFELPVEDDRIRCLGEAIAGAGRDPFLAAIAAGPQSPQGLALAETFTAACPTP